MNAVAHTAAAPRGFVFLLLAAYLILLPVQLRAGGTLRVAPADAFMGAALILLIATGSLQFRKGAFSAWHLLLVAMFALGITVTAVRELGASRYVLLNKGVGIVVLAAGYTVFTTVVTSWTRVRWLLRVFVAGAVIQTILAMMAFVARYAAGIRVPAMNEYSGRLSGMLVDPNAFGGYLVLALAVLLPATTGPRPLVRPAAGMGAALVLSIGILLTFSRSAWLALAVVLAVASVYDLRLAVRAIIIGSAGFAAVLAVSGLDYLTTILALALRGGTAHARLEFIDVALRTWAETPVLGTGLGYFLANEGWIIHNTPLWVLAEFGIVGFGLFAGFLAWFLWAGVGTFRRAPASERPVVFGLVLAFLAMGALSAGIEALYQRHWWFVMALIAGSHAVVIRRRRGTEAAPGKVVPAGGSTPTMQTPSRAGARI